MPETIERPATTKAKAVAASPKTFLARIRNQLVTAEITVEADTRAEAEKIIKGWLTQGVAIEG